MRYSTYQVKIFNRVESSDRNIIIDAVAGSGKSTTLFKIASIVSKFDEPQNVLFFAFNNHIAKFASEKLSKCKNVKVVTTHAYGLSCIKKSKPNKGRPNFSKSEMNASKVWNHIEANVKNFKMRGLFYSALTTLRTFGCMSYTDKGITKFVRENPAILNQIGDTKIFSYASTIGTMMQALDKETHHYDFDDMMRFPIIYDLLRYGEKTDILLIDEAQDLGLYQFNFVEHFIDNGTRIIAVGDECQPVGTKVSVVRRRARRNVSELIKEVDISKVKVGDTVCSMRVGGKRLRRSRKITGISCRPYNGELVCVKTDTGMLSKYTTNHHCIASFSALKDKYCVYMMEKDGCFRVGKAKMFYKVDSKCGTNAGLLYRLRAENADKLWILDLYDSEIEALIGEKTIAYTYGIPELMFTAKNNAVLKTKVLNKIWSNLKNGKLGIRARKCLTKFGRLYAFPLVTRNTAKGDKGWYSGAVPVVVHACNLLSGCLVPVYSRPENKGKRDGYVEEHTLYKPITVYRENYEGDVYSLSVEEDHTYCADGIITHNCQAIYSFRGACGEALNTIKELCNARRMPLSITYRCKSRIVDFVHKQYEKLDYEPPIESFEKGGHVYELVGTKDDEYNLETLLKNNVEMVVSAKNKHIISIWFYLLERYQMTSSLKGSKITTMLTKMFKGLKANNTPFHSVLDELRKQLESKDETIVDMAATCIRFASLQNFKDYDAVFRRISQIDHETNAKIHLHTVHSAKGLEAEKVFVINDWFDSDQKQNMMYVAYTRASDELYVITPPKEPYVKPKDKGTMFGTKAKQEF